jgi:hypothetical protein
MMRKGWFVLLVAMISCTSTRFTGIVDNKPMDKSIRSMVVLSRNLDERTGRLIQKKLKESFRKEGLRIHAWGDLFPPGHPPEDGSVAVVLIHRGIDSVLEIVAGNPAVQDSNADVRESETNTYRVAPADSASPIFQWTPVTKTKIIKIRGRKVRFISTLYDSRTRDVLWRGISITDSEGAIYTSLSSTISSYVKALKKEIMKIRCHARPSLPPPPSPPEHSKSMYDET